MTNDNKKQQERRLDDERCVDALLAEGGFPDDGELRDVLLQLRSVRVTAVPEPSPEVAALLGQSRNADVMRLEDWSRRHPRKKRAVFTTLAVAASLGIAGGAAAGNETLRSRAEGTISGIIRSFSPPGPQTPEPTTTAPASPPAEAPKPAPAVVPSPAGTPATVPAVPVPAPAETVAPDATTVTRERQESKVPEQGSQNFGKGATLNSPQPGVKPAQPGVSHPAGPPPRAGDPAGVRADVPADGKTKTNADADGGTGQSSAQPKALPSQGNRP